MLKPLNLVSKYSNMEQDRLFRFQPFKLPNSTTLRSTLVYASGALVRIILSKPAPKNIESKY